MRVRNMDDKNIKNNFRSSSTPSLDIDEERPEDCYETVNRFGRCNVQATNNTNNDYPAIAQGLAESTKESVQQESKRWRAQNGKESGGKYKH